MCGSPSGIEPPTRRRPRDGSDGGLAPTTDEAASAGVLKQDAADAEAAGLFPKAEAESRGQSAVSKPDGGEQDVDHEFQEFL